ncbi:hypothetical protein ACPUGQ_10150 [Klebsiella aerogenes]|uniref:hypothetical protein n=1 Tax=Klebsiella aerogenes TaxID=548 RepID=UPI003D351A24
MTDITRLLASLKRRSAHAKEFGHDVLFVKLEDIDALVEALELKEEQRANWFQMAQKLGEDLDAAEKHIAELEEAEQKLCAANVTLDARAELAERQLAELESRTVTVKLPQAVSAGGQGYQEKVERILTAAGIKWEAE